MNNNKWLSKRSKVEYNPPSLFHFAACQVVNSEIKDEFAWKLISQHNEIKYKTVSEICYRCINLGLDVCAGHKKYLSTSVVPGSSLKYTDHIAVLPWNN